MSGDRGKASFYTRTYKLRSSGAMPIAPGEFLIQSFGIDRTRTGTWEATEFICESSDMVGASIDGKYTSATFQRLSFFSESGGNLFNAVVVYKPVWINAGSEYIPGGDD